MNFALIVKSSTFEVSYEATDIIYIWPSYSAVSLTNDHVTVEFAQFHQSRVTGSQADAFLVLTCVFSLSAFIPPANHRFPMASSSTGKVFCRVPIFKLPIYKEPIYEMLLPTWQCQVSIHTGQKKLFQGSICHPSHITRIRPSTLNSALGKEQSRIQT